MEELIERFVSVGNSYGNGYGDGYGNGDGNGITEINRHKVYKIDKVPTIIVSVHGNYAKGFTLRNNVIFVPCYIVKVGDCFAHGSTLHEAMTDAEAKYNQSLPIEQRIKNTITKYPTLDTLVSNRELFALHNLLTGSCKFGREQFCQRHNINLDNSMTMQEFIDVTRNDYGGNIIRQLEVEYKTIEKNG